MKKFSKNKKRNNIIIISVVIVVGIVSIVSLIKSHAYFSTSKSFDVLKGKVPNFTKGDITLAVIVDGVKQEDFPDKNGYKYVGYECNNDAKLTWNNETWRVLIDTDKPTICTLKFETKNNSLNGSEPVVKEGLIPIVIANDGTVTKANIKDKWYSYEESKWANAVILNEADNYKEGDIIPEEAIESYFVWIPKYRYKLFNVEGNSIPAQEIEIEIGDYNTVDSETECKATNKSGDNGTCENGKWMTHPAFTSLDVTGIWVGKFETTGTVDKVTVKPNIASLRDIDGSTMYNTSYNYKRNLDSHMMKNTEWGALVYLTNSKYGRGNSEVWINNYWNNETKTGCTGESASASSTTSCANPYGNGKNNVHGSTTDNISGIYDTSGGAWDMVMGNFNNTQSNFGSTAVSSILSRYKDIYTGASANTNKILGDATGETQGWNGDYAVFAYSTAPWFIRGGYYSNSTVAGIFFFSRGNADVSYNGSFRVVLFTK